MYLSTVGILGQGWARSFHELFSSSGEKTKLSQKLGGKGELLNYFSGNAYWLMFLHPGLIPSLFNVNL